MHIQKCRMNLVESEEMIPESQEWEKKKKNMSSRFNRKGDCKQVQKTLVSGGSTACEQDAKPLFISFYLLRRIQVHLGSGLQAAVGRLTTGLVKCCYTLY